MDRLKLETVYLRALDALMLAVDEYQIQAAIFRLRRAQARLHGWEVWPAAGSVDGRLS
jgi:hypothetical protein